MPTAVSLFSGCGGSDAGVIRAGFDVLLSNDIIPYARDVYLANHPETDYVLKDIRKITTFPASELLVGCYPCQGFSQGGARKADRTINYLYLEFARALNTIQPKAFVVENVAGMRRSTYQHLLDDQINRFTSAGEHGYDVSWRVLNAEDYGVAQQRRRIIIVGIRRDLGEKYSFPLPTHGEGCKEPVRTIADEIADLPAWPDGEFFDTPFHWYYLSRNRRRDWNELSKTIVANQRHIPLHPISPPLEKLGDDEWRFITNEPARRFSFREAARLQGFGREGELGAITKFPDTESASLANKYKVIGNAVPPPLFEAVIRALPNVWS